MTIVNIYDAKAQLSALIAEAQAGGDVIIAKAGQPVVRLVPIEARTSRVPGGSKGLIWVSQDFDAPLDDLEAHIYEAGK